MILQEPISTLPAESCADHHYPMQRYGSWWSSQLRWIVLDRCCSYCTEPDVFEKLRLFHCKLITIANFPAVTSNVFHCILHHFSIYLSIYLYIYICLLPNAPAEVNKRHRAELHSLLVKLKGMHGLHFIRCFRPNKDGLARGVAAD